DAGSPWRALDGWRLNGGALRRLGFRDADSMREVDVGALPGGGWQVTLDGVTIAATAARAADGTLIAALGPRRLSATVVASGDKRHVFISGRHHLLSHVDLLRLVG